MHSKMLYAITFCLAVDADDTSVARAAARRVAAVDDDDDDDDAEAADFRGLGGALGLGGGPDA